MADVEYADDDPSFFFDDDDYLYVEDEYGAAVSLSEKTQTPNFPTLNSALRFRERAFLACKKPLQLFPPV